MLAPSLPRGYNKTLQRAFPECRIRWSERLECWLLEQKAHYARVDIDPSKYPRDAVDTFIQRRDGYFTAGRYHPNRLPPADLLVRILRANDSRTVEVDGGTPEERAANWCKRVEEREREAVAKANKDVSFTESGLGSELYDQLAWAEGRRVSVPANLPGV